MKHYTTADMAIAEVQFIALQKKATLLASQLQEPVIVLARDSYKLDYSEELRLRYTLYFKSPFDPHFTKVNQFHSLEDLCLWYVSKHPYKEFKLLNYTQI